MLLPPQFKDEALKALGPPIRKEEEKKPVEVEVRPGIYRVNGKLETRFKLEEDQAPVPVVIEHDVDIPLPEFKAGDVVVVIDKSCDRYGQTGVVQRICKMPEGTPWYAVGVLFDDGIDDGYPNDCLAHETR